MLRWRSTAVMLLIVCLGVAPLSACSSKKNSGDNGSASRALARAKAREKAKGTARK